MKKLLSPDHIPQHIQRDIAAMVPDALQQSVSIEHLTAYEAFDYYLRCNGIIGWTDRITEALDAIRNAERVQKLRDNAQQAIE